MRERLLDRRGFLTAAGAATLASGAEARAKAGLTKPAALRPGDTVAVVNPSTAIYDPAAAERAAATIEALGLKPMLPPGLLKRPRDWAGSLRHRLDELHGAFADPGVKGVFCARGGYGVSEIVAHVDYGLIGRNPKVFLGFSDITLLHLAIWRRAGLVTFHGRMPSQAKFPAYSLEALRRAVCETAPLGEMRNPPESHALRPAYPLRTITAGVAEGPLVGGNLTMVLAALGTPWDLETRGALLFLEDVDEPPYSVARMLLHLRQAGRLQGVAGIVLGAFASANSQFDVSPYSLNEVFEQVLGDLKVPVFSGLAFGHTDEQLTLPHGVRARVDAGARTLTVLEAGVA